jgi:hypothetical protein
MQLVAFGSKWYSWLVELAQPINFNKVHKSMLAHCKMVFEIIPIGKITINPDKFNKIIAFT